MRFSILVPVYNAEAYLSACVDSVLSQTEQDFELVLVDDGSTDGCPALCDAYAQRYPSLIRVLHQPNAGLIAARRAGIRLAQGDTCLFLDADDALEPDTLATVRAAMERTGAQMVIFNYLDVFEQAQRNIPAAAVFEDGRVFCGADKQALYAELIRGWRLNNLCTKAIDRALVQADATDYTPYFGNPNTEDLLQTLDPITRAETVAYLSKPLYRYRRREDSISSLALTGQMEKQFNEPVMEKLRAYMTVWGMDGETWLKAYHTRRFYGLISLFWQHYRVANAGAEKQAVLDFDWESHITAEDRAYLDNNDLDKSRKIQLKAILNRNKPLLALFELAGGMKMRLRHGA